MEEILKNWLPKMIMADLQFYLDRHGDTDETRIMFYQTFLNQSDKEIMQNDREQQLNVTTSLSDEEYIELQEVRQYCVEQIRDIKAMI